MKTIFLVLSIVITAGLSSAAVRAAETLALPPSKVSHVSVTLSESAKRDAKSNPQFWLDDALTAFNHYVWHHNNDNDGFPAGASASIQMEITSIKILPLPDRTLFAPPDEITASYTITDDRDGHVIATGSANSTNKGRALDASRMRQIYRALIMSALERMEP